MDGAAIFLLLLSVFHIFLKVYTIELDIISDSQFLTDGDTLVSRTGIFELGFFRPGGSKNSYLGIWYKKIDVKTVVWVANRDYPLHNTSLIVLRIVDPGILVLSSNTSMIWSSNTTMTSRNATAKLYDTGNLVLMDQQEKVLWQSFDYPTDTLLPGMKLGRDFLRGIEWHLSSWKSSQDPSSGGFTWGATTRGYPENKLKKGEEVIFRGGPWSNQRVRGYGYSIYTSTTTSTYKVVMTEKEVSFAYNVENSSILSKITLSSSGELEISEWLDDGKNWHLSLTLPVDSCDTYNVCGAYGSCSVNMVQPSCACLDDKRFVPRNQTAWETADWSDGCARQTPLDCENGSEGFIKYSNVKLPDRESTLFYINMTSEKCLTTCLENCSCMAYANIYTRFEENGCLHWFDDLLDIRVFPQGSIGLDLFVRMASSELVDQSHFKKQGEAKIKIILLVIFLGVLICLISTCLWYARNKRNRMRMLRGGRSLQVSKKREEDIRLPLFSFSTIATATASFSTDNMLGEGGFGPVYKGLLEEGLEIAVKRLSKTSNQGVDEFKNEVLCVSRLQHRNLVKLIGCCIKEDEKLLIYEYMPNKSLDSILFDEKRSMLLDWTQRFNIIKGIARGLLYLHHDSRLRIIHRDLKASNILLDLDMNPKISDFGLARSFGGNETQAKTQRVVGTYGYMSPEYVQGGVFSIKSDVFSFGVLVLEIISGKRNRGFIHPEDDITLIGHAWSVYIEGRSMELIDASLAESCHPLEVSRSVQVGLLCVQQHAGDRPKMLSVVRMLDGEGALPQPKQPAFFTGKGLLVVNSSSNKTVNSINGLTNTQLDAR